MRIIAAVKSVVLDITLKWIHLKSTVVCEAIMFISDCGPLLLVKIFPADRNLRTRMIHML